MIFFFKQKTAYEMRISDWSSDVCSSDLVQVMVGAQQPVGAEAADRLGRLAHDVVADVLAQRAADRDRVQDGGEDRKSVVWGKSVSVRVDLGGRRIIKQKIRFSTIQQIKEQNTQQSTHY